MIPSREKGQRKNKMIANFSLKENEAKRQKNTIFKVLKEKKSQTKILYPEKISFKKQEHISEIKTGRICLWNICTTRNTKAFSSDRREMLSDENLDTQKRMKSTKNSKYVDITQTKNNFYFY